MKKNFMYLMTMMMVAMLSVGFASCGSDDDDGGSSSYDKLIVGAWKQTHRIIYDADGSVNFESDRETSMEIFGEDGTYTYIEGYITESTKWSVTGNRLILGNENYIIISLTENSMTLEYDFRDGRVEVTTYRKVNEEE